MVSKIRRAKLIPKLMLLTVLMITMITGFTGIFVTANENNKRSTKLTFEAVETMPWPEGWIPLGEPWGDGKFIHQRYYKTATLVGTIEDIGAFSGYDELYLHVRMDPATFEVISIGKVTLYIFCENGLEGTFYGSVVSKGVAGVGPFDGKLKLQGTGDFEGWKLFSEVWLIFGPINGLSGTILIPN